MTYKELQQAFKPYKEDGQTDITLNSPKPIFEAEYERLTVAKTEETEAENVTSLEFHNSQWVSPDDDAGKISQPEPSLSEKLELTDMLMEPKDDGDYIKHCDDLEDRVDDFLLVVGRKELSDEQLGAIAIAMFVGDGRNITISEALARMQKFNFFTPDQHLKWGFNQIIPRQGLYLQFRKAMANTVEPEAEEPDLFEIEDDNELADKIDDFFLAVKQGQLSQEQLEAVTLAMVVAHRKHTNLSMELAYLRKFHHFTPNQLLAWGFDQIIPAEGLLIQLRNAIASTIKPTTAVNVSVYVNAGDEEKTALLELWASSYGGKSWYTGMGEGLLEEGWEFPSIESAEKFTEYCQKLEFVQAAKIDRISSNVAVPSQKLTELKMTVTQ